MIDSNNRLLFFTDPYPDELMYSVLARLHHYSYGLSFAKIQKILFGSKRIHPNLNLVFSLDSLVCKLSDFYRATELRDKHTIYPFLAPFLTQQQKEKVNRAIFKGENTAQVIVQSGLRAHNYSKISRELMYCPLCAVEDQKKYGEAYLHMSHHLPGIEICLKHLVYLEKYPLKYPEDPTHLYIFLEPERLRTDYRMCNCPHELALAKSAQQLLESEKVRYERIASCLKQLLRDKGYFSGTNFKALNLYEDLLCYYGEDYLKRKGCLLESSQLSNLYDTYLSVYRTPSRVHSAPHQFLLIINFLCESFDNLLKVKPQENTILNTGMPCHNPFCRHYEKKEIHDLNLITKKDYFEIIARCECGMIYSCTSKNLENYKVVQYGKLFFEKIKALYRKGIGITKIARENHISKKTVRLISEDELVSDPIDQKITDYRKQALDLISKDPGITTESLAKISYPILYYLNRYDRKWFEEHFLHRHTVLKADFSENDNYLYQEARNYQKELLLLKPPERITQRRIIEKLGLKKCDLEKYPRTCEFVRSVAESHYDYFKREIDPILDYIISLGLNLTQKTLKRFGFRHSFTTEAGKKIWDYARERYNLEVL